MTLPHTASLIRRGWPPIALPVEGSGLRLIVRLDGQDLGLRFVRVSFLDPTSAAFSRVTLSAGLSEGSYKPQLALSADGNGRFSWTGLLPKTVRHLELAPTFDDFLPPLTNLELAEPHLARLVGTGLMRRPHLVAEAGMWRLVRKRLRAKYRLEAAVQPRALAGYADWIARFDTVTAADRARMRAEIAGWTAPPALSVLMPVYNPDPAVLEKAIASVRGQLYPHWQLCIADDASNRPGVSAVLERAAAAERRIRLIRRGENGHISRATNSALEAATGTFCAFLDHDDLLPENALYEVARALIANPDLDLIYSDEDKVDAKGKRFEPHFKPDWNPELLLAQNYLNHLTVIRTDLIRRVGGLRPGFEGSQDHDLLMRIADDLAPDRVLHIPKVLYHWRAAIGSGTFSDAALATAEAARLRALDETIARRGWPHRAERGPAGFNRLVRALPEPAPLVSVVIPTRDRAELLSVALDGLLTKTDYPAIEVVIVDNDSVEPETAALFARYRDDPRVRVVKSPGKFNFSKLSNAGAEAARGDVLLFLNNDIEVVEPGWLRELVSIAAEPHVGAVGAKLFYPDWTLQHGGVVLGAGGIAGHSHLGIEREDPGYFARMVVSQQVSAVTGACLAMRKAVFEEIGGFDAERLSVAFNDIDLCLRATEAGYQVIWTPHAVLIHHESKSRGHEDTPEKRARFEGETKVMVERWSKQLSRDPFYNLNLSRAKANFKLS
ncbi:glycosyltransferase family 2 protein [Methylobacterium gnaphalii]|uniref:Glycosyltransferase 2-like domain-containing protein n=1 Tax=Methylobacterium gnaphalii TaxID=1010610 RepID=A0A512JHM9_9HYPH|nr:glycosyltransferase family 2 protein [Methylobacterium gnaphalii]GEP09455.1 hypothetical protein MGN01_13000 [Methylobacterium gnaphalii]GJD68066.1 hypothetical protein MMMDOFMJ_0984 [Methylobacterium gnaphalii]GLS49156.1 hypothetical protein GCM10007885_20040 [Methylobacterium gnaphalii]